MKKFYEKSELGFALVWIGIYCLGMSAFDEISRSLGIESIASAVFALAVSAFLFLWLKNQGLLVRYGLCKPSAPAKEFLFYIPLAAITVFNLWSGLGLGYGVPDIFCFIIKMLCVGFLEEVIFRGLLFKAISRSSIMWAVLVSSLTFGLGHILNLINGSGMSFGENMVQIVSAVLIGFLYVLIFVRSGSLWGCILSHGIFNSLSAFSSESENGYAVIILCLITVAYALFIFKGISPEQLGRKTKAN